MIERILRSLGDCFGQGPERDAGDAAARRRNQRNEP